MKKANETGKFALIYLATNTGWYGPLKGDVIFHVETRTNRKETGLLADVLGFPTHLFCDVVKGRYVESRKFKGCGLDQNNGNLGSFSACFELPFLNKVKRTLKAAGYTIVKGKDKIKERTEHEKQTDNLMNAIFSGR